MQHAMLDESDFGSPFTLRDRLDAFVSAGGGVLACPVNEPLSADHGQVIASAIATARHMQVPLHLDVPAQSPLAQMLVRLGLCDVPEIRTVEPGKEVLG